jgi:hypothetical protein
MSVLMPSVAHAKRKAPPKVEPVVFEGVRYTAPNDDGRRAYVQAWQTSTNRMLWEVTVFRNRINPLAEEDVQHVYIRQMRIRDGKLIVIAEDDRVFSVDLKTRAVERLEKMPTEKTQANKPDAVNPAMTLRYAIVDHCRRVTDPERWAAP